MLVDTVSCFKLDQNVDCVVYSIVEWIQEEARRDYMMSAIETKPSTINASQEESISISNNVLEPTTDEEDGENPIETPRYDASLSTPNIHGGDGVHCDPPSSAAAQTPPDQNRPESLLLFTESDKANNNAHDQIDSSFHSKSSLQSNSNEFEFDQQQTSDWDLKQFLMENSALRNDIDVFIMSEAGKPIYCYSRRKDVTTLMGVCVALVNYVIKTQNDQLKTIRTQNGLNINFAVRSPLVIVVVGRSLSCFDEQTLINQIHAQVISTITLKKLKSIFQQASTYDLRRIIHKNDFKTLDILIKSITTPITDLFPTFKNKKSKTSGRIFNNVISFYTSASISMPRSSSSSTTTTTTVSGSNSSLNQNNNNSSMIFLHDHKPNVLSRVFVPVAIMNGGFREQITTIINQSVAINPDIVFSILFHIEDDDDDNVDADDSNEYLTEWNSFNNTASTDDDDDDDEDDDESNDLYESFESQDQDSNSTETSQQKPPRRKTSTSTRKDSLLNHQHHHHQSPPSTLTNSKVMKNLKLISVCNHTVKFRINPLDIQLIYALIKASDSLLTSTESLWLPLCLSRVDANRFLHAHVSYLSKKYCLILLDVDHNNFEKCRQVKENIHFRLDQIRSAEPMTGLRSSISELGQPHLQYICHQTPKHCVVWQSSIQTEFSPLNYYLIDRMQRSSLKTLWLRSMKEQCALLGWQTATFQLYAQFDGFVSKQSALETVTTFIKWFKKEEDKFLIKD